MKAKLISHYPYQEDRRYKNNWSLKVTFQAEDGETFTEKIYVGDKVEIEKMLETLQTVGVMFTARFDGNAYRTDYEYVKYEYHYTTKEITEVSNRNGYFATKEEAFNNLVKKEMSKLEESMKKVSALTPDMTYEKYKQIKYGA